MQNVERTTMLCGVQRPRSKLRCPFPLDLATLQSWSVQRWKLSDLVPHSGVSIPYHLALPHTSQTQKPLEKKMQRQLFEHRSALPIRHKALKFSRHLWQPMSKGLCLRDKTEGLLSNRKSTQLTVAFIANKASQGITNRASTRQDPINTFSSLISTKRGTCYSIKTAPATHSCTTC